MKKKLYLIIFLMTVVGLIYLIKDYYFQQNRGGEERQTTDSGQGNPLPTTFDFNGKSFVHIHNQTRDTVHLATYYESAVLYEDYREKLIIPPSEKVKKELRTEGFKYLKLTIYGDDYRVFTSRGAEVIVEINPTTDSVRLEFAGEYAAINEFIQEEARHFGYHSDEKMTHYQAMANERSFVRLVEMIDSIGDLHQDFLKNSAEDLPAWYLSYESQRLDYVRIHTKLNDLMYRKILLDIDDKVGDNFLEETATLTLNNTDLLASGDYHRYLNDYFFIKNAPNLTGTPNGLDEQKKNFKSKFALESHELNGMARDVYLTRQLTNRIKKYRYMVDSSMLSYVKDSTLNAYLKSLYASSGVLPSGTEVPYFYLTDIEGNYFTPADFKGKVLLINFWSVGCKPCIKEIPEENLLVKDYKDKPVAVVNICMSSREELWRKVSKKHNIEAVNLFAQGNWSDKISKDFDVSGWPHSILIDKDGKVVANHTLRASAIRPMIDDLLSNFD